MKVKAVPRGSSSEPIGPWHEIVPRLFMGGHFYTTDDGEVRSAIALDEFDAVFSLVRIDGHGPLNPATHHMLEIPDAELDREQIAATRGFAAEATKAYADGGTIFVRCRWGFNRSGMIVAQMLVNSGYKLGDAVELIRARRAPSALNNTHFIEYLLAGLSSES